jgi:hypothetical protein
MKKEITPTEYEQNLHDVAALLAMTGLLMRKSSYDVIVPVAFDLADEFMRVRKERIPQSGV